MSELVLVSGYSGYTCSKRRKLVCRGFGLRVGQFRQQGRLCKGLFKAWRVIQAYKLTFPTDGKPMRATLASPLFNSYKKDITVGLEAACLFCTSNPKIESAMRRMRSSVCSAPVPAGPDFVVGSNSCEEFNHNDDVLISNCACLLTITRKLSL